MEWPVCPGHSLGQTSKQFFDREEIKLEQSLGIILSAGIPPATVCVVIYHYRGNNMLNARIITCALAAAGFAQGEDGRGI